jgi:hypothetical protein
VTNPKQARATDSGRYYEDPNPAFDGALYPSVTNVIDTSVAKPVLLPWTAKVTAEYALDNLVELMALALVNREAALKALKAQYKLKRDDALNLGSLVHAAAERHNLGLPIEEQDPRVLAFTYRYLMWLAEWGVDVAEDIEAAEVSVVHRGIGYAGTLDLIISLRSGLGGQRERWLIDLKTSSTQKATAVYREHALQLSALRYAKVAWLPGGLEVPVPEVDRCGVLNLRIDDHALIEMPADRAAFAAFQGALATTKWLHGLNLKASTAVVRPPSRTTAVKEAA